MIGLYLLLSNQSAFFREVEPNQQVRRSAGWNALLWALSFAPILIGITVEESGYGHIRPAASSLYTLLLVPGIAAFFMQLMEMNKTIRWFLVLSMILPAIFIVWHYLNPQLWIVYANIVYWGIYSLGFILWLIRLEHLYNKRLKDLYADTEGHNISWINHLLVLFVVYFALFVLAYSQGNYTAHYLTYSFCIVLWFYLTYQVDRHECAYQFWLGMKEAPALEGEPTEESGYNDATEAENESENYEREWIGERIKKVCEEEQLYLRHDLNVNVLASFVGTNRSYISQYLSSHNLTYYGYINSLRVQHAKKLIEENNGRTLSDIAFHSGFKSVATFRRAFLEIEKCTPSEYQRR